MKCNRKGVLRAEISHDWNNLNLAAQILVCIGGIIFASTVFMVFYKTKDDTLYKVIEVVFRSSLASIFGFVLSSNIKNTNPQIINKSKNEDDERSITEVENEDDCIKYVNYKEGNSIQIVIAFVISIVCALSILAIYIYDLRQDLLSITMFRDFMCSSIGFLLGESKIKKDI